MLTNQESINVINSLIKQFTRLEQPTAVEGLEAAKEALEKQLPMKVERFIKNRTKDVLGAGDCPKCNRLVVEPQEYCPHCGQALNWGDEDWSDEDE